MYYFRYAFNEKYREKFQRSELRVTLRTPYLRTAKHLAGKLCVYLEDLLMDDTHETYAEFRAELVQKLQSIIESGEKKNPVTIATIRQRLDKVRQDMLDNADSSLYRPPSGVLFDEGQAVSIPPGANLEFQHNTVLKTLFDRPDHFSVENYPEVILELLHKKIFAPEELTTQTIKMIISEFLKVQISLNRIMSSREKGDYAYERKFLPETQTPIPDNSEHFQKIEDRLDEIVENKQAVLTNIEEHLDEIIESKRAALTSVVDRFDEIVETKQLELANVVDRLDKIVEAKQPVQANAVEPDKPNHPDLKISELIEKYVTTKVKDSHWEPHSVPDHRGRLSYSLAILSDKNIGDITRDEMRYFRDVLCKLPPRIASSKKYRNKTIDKILQMKPAKVLSVATVNLIVEAVSSMFKWAIQEGLLAKNPAQGLQLKDNRQEISLKPSFTREDLKKIFNDDFKKQSLKNPAYYWAPLIALYTGMRLEEICQLHCADILQENDIWYFDINENLSLDDTADKKLKTKNAIRTVPIHKKLIELGFLDFFKGVEGKHERIFHLLNNTTSKKRYGRQVSQNFSRYLAKIGLTGGKSFHSFRHTFSDFFKKRQMHNDIFRQVFGHEISELAGKQYGSKFSVEQCYHELIALIDYDQL